MGCGETLEPVGEVHDDIECNVLTLDDGQARVVLIGIDALYPGPELRRYLDERFRGILSPDQIFLAASHTHSAPQLDSTKPALGSVDEGHLEFVCGSVGDLVERLLSQPGEDVRVVLSRYRSTVMVNRRRRRLLGGAEKRITFNSVIAAPNARATGRQYGHLVSLVGSNGPVGFLWQLPCHPVGLPRGWGNSAHFPGVGRRILRDTASPTTPVVFLQGFSGDLRPVSASKPSSLVGRARRLLLGAWFTPFTARDYGRWTGRVAAELSEAAKASKNADPSEDARLEARRVSVALSEYHAGNPGNRTMTVHRLSIGEVTLLGVSAEPVSGYAEALLARSDIAAIPVGCIDDVSGYAPTRRVLKEGGYEGTGFAQHFGLGMPRPVFESVLRTQMDEALN